MPSLTEAYSQLPYRMSPKEPAPLHRHTAVELTKIVVEAQIDVTGKAQQLLQMTSCAEVWSQL